MKRVYSKPSLSKKLCTLPNFTMVDKRSDQVNATYEMKCRKYLNNSKYDSFLWAPVLYIL